MSSKEELFVIKRILDAPVEIVWRVWTEPEHIMRWWGPKDYTSPVCEVNLQVGGKYLFCMQAPAYQAGQTSYSAGVYKKIVPMESLEYIQDNLTDKEGNPINPQKAGMPDDFPAQSRITVNFKPIGNLTELTITVHDWKMGQMYVFAYAGWQQSLDKLAETFLGNKEDN